MGTCKTAVMVMPTEREATEREAWRMRGSIFTLYREAFAARTVLCGHRTCLRRERGRESRVCPARAWEVELERSRCVVCGVCIGCWVGVGGCAKSLVVLCAICIHQIRLVVVPSYCSFRVLLYVCRN